MSEERKVLPDSYVNGRYSNELYYFMRNNASEAAAILKKGLAGALYQCDGPRVAPTNPEEAAGNAYQKLLGYPIDPIPRSTYVDPDTGETKYFVGQVLDSRFFDSVGMYQAVNTGHVNGVDYRLNALHVFGAGFALRPFAQFLVSHKFNIKLLIDSVLTLSLRPFEITESVNDSVAVEGREYYELEDNSPYTPASTAYCIKCTVGHVVKDPEVEIPHGVLVDDYIKYFWIDTSGDNATYRRCNVLRPTSTMKYQTKNDDGTYESILAHSVGELAGQNIYVMRKVNGVWVTNEVPIGAADEHTVIIGKTRPTNECNIYRKILPGDTVPASARYIDRSNEVVELIRKYVDVILTHYRPIAIVKRMPVFRYSAIPATEMYTLTDLIVRINDIARCFGFDPIPDGTTVDDLYTVRQMKLKLNEAIAIINNERFYKYLLLEDADWQGTGINPFYKRYGVGNITDVLWSMIRMNDVAWEDLVASADVEHTQQTDWPSQFNGYSYADLGVTYVPKTRAEMDAKWDVLDLTNYGSSSTVVNPYNGKVLKRTSSRGPVLVDGSATPLNKVVDLYRIADVWSKCDYTGSMYVLATSKKMLDGTSITGSSWLDMFNALMAEDGITSDVATTLGTITEKMEQLAGEAQVAAMFIVDLMVRVVEYGFRYAPHRP